MIQEQERQLAEKLLYEYAERGETKLEKLQKLDRKVKRPAEVFALIFGVAGALVLGVGMCLAMKIIGDLMPLGIVVGVVGIAMVTVNFFLYRAVVNSRKKKYAGEVLELSGEMLNQSGQEK